MSTNELFDRLSKDLRQSLDEYDAARGKSVAPADWQMLLNAATVRLAAADAFGRSMSFNNEES